MKFFYGATGGHLTYINLLTKRLIELDQDFEVYDFGGSGIGKHFGLDFGGWKGSSRDGVTYYPKIPAKPLIVLDMMYTNKQDELLVYLDVDTFVVEQLPEIDTDDYDVGITIHPKEIHGKGYGNERFPEKTSYLNAGVIFFRNNPKAIEFVRKWMMSTMFNSDNHSDQEGLTAMVKHADLDYYKVVDIDGVRVKCFPTEIYNNCVRQPEVEGIKIRHAAGFKGVSGIKYLKKNIPVKEGDVVFVEY